MATNSTTEDLIVYDALMELVKDASRQYLSKVYEKQKDEMHSPSGWIRAEK